MGKMGQYCKAYPLEAMRQFSGWRENGDPRDDDHIVYVQESYVVTDGIFIDENIVFDEVTDEWKEFCHNTLNFELPDLTAERPQTLATNA
jgi:hypothetical protein